MQNTAKTLETVDTIPAQPEIDLAEAMAQVAADVRADAARRSDSYLRETIVPEGGE